MFFQQIFNRPTPQIQTTNEAASCPNCWGVSQWGEKDCPRHFDIDKGSVSEVNSRNGFIRRFVKRFVK